jgi:hypothetical protein
MGIRRVAGLVWNRLLMRVDNSTGKGTSLINVGSGFSRTACVVFLFLSKKGHATKGSGLF